ncbi:MAG: RluA family pseudouridine synthase [Deltaproteobacteria bacterium]|nr:RluA family pseudouridine synthase [Deltaproteobacteria bacterium]
MIAVMLMAMALEFVIVGREYRLPTHDPTSTETDADSTANPAGPALTHEFEITDEEAHERLDVVLARRLNLSRAQTRKLLEEGGVHLDGSPIGRAVKGLAVEPGSRVGVVGFVHPRDRHAVAEPDAALVVLAEGAGWVAIDKPAGAPVHPLEADETGTLLNALVARWPEMQGVGEGGLRSGILHRLDLDTSGAMLFATEAETWDRLRGAFARHEFAKTYRALVAGAAPDEGRLDYKLAVAQHKPAFVKVAEGQGGRPTRMSYRTVERFERSTLVEVALETGFLHQVRVGFAHLGHPVLGDTVYGAEAAGAAPRQMLHCAHLVFEEIEAQSPDPEDFCEAIALQRTGA